PRRRRPAPRSRARRRQPRRDRRRHRAPRPLRPHRGPPHRLVAVRALTTGEVPSATIARMTWRVRPFARAAEPGVTHRGDTYAPPGIVIAGSIVRGEGGPTSDLDVFVVHDQPWRLREQKRFAGVPAELFVNPPARVRTYFEREHAEGHPSTAHMFA